MGIWLFLSQSMKWWSDKWLWCFVLPPSLFPLPFPGDGEWGVHAASCQPAHRHHIQRRVKRAQWRAGVQCRDGLGEVQHPGEKTPAATGNLGHSDIPGCFFQGEKNEGWQGGAGVLLNDIKLLKFSLTPTCIRWLALSLHLGWPELSLGDLLHCSQVGLAKRAHSSSLSRQTCLHCLESCIKTPVEEKRLVLLCSASLSSAAWFVSQPSRCYSGACQNGFVGMWCFI